MLTFVTLLCFGLANANNSLDFPIKSVESPNKSSEYLVDGKVLVPHNIFDQITEAFDCTIHAEFTDNGIDYTIHVEAESCMQAFEIFNQIVNELLG